MSEQGNQVAKAAAFIAGGAVIGAGLGLLFAPQTGAETHRSMRERDEATQDLMVLPIVRPRTPVWRPMGSPIGAVAHIGIGANARCFILVAPHAQIVDA